MRTPSETKNGDGLACGGRYLSAGAVYPKGKMVDWGFRGGAQWKLACSGTAQLDVLVQQYLIAIRILEQYMLTSRSVGVREP